MFLSFLFVLLIPLASSYKTAPPYQSKRPYSLFRCNSVHDLRDLAIEQVFMRGNHAYILRGNQFIFFANPFCFFNAGKQILCMLSPMLKMDTEFKIEMNDKKFQHRGLSSFSFYEFNPFSLLITYRILTMSRLFIRKI